jgi:hypothetical protein
MSAELDPTTTAFYRSALRIGKESGVPFLVGGAYALAGYTGIDRHTKDLDLYVRPANEIAFLQAFAESGYRTELTHPHWLGKVFADGAMIDVIFNSGNAVVEVDDEWFTRAVPGHLLDVPVALCPVEEMIWSKAFVMERERFDGADVAHLIRARAESLDWPHLVRRFGRHWRVLLSHFILFGYIYPAERGRIPAGVMAELLGRLAEQPAEDLCEGQICQGTYLSRSQYLVDIGRWGYLDARLAPRGPMSQADVDHWTDSIRLDGSW